MGFLQDLEGFLGFRGCKGLGVQELGFADVGGGPAAHSSYQLIEERRGFRVKAKVSGLRFKSVGFSGLGALRGSRV